MMCVCFFFVSVTTFWCSNILCGVKSKKIPIVFKSVRINPKKSNRKTRIFTQSQFLTKSIFLWFYL
ncbi:Uncharacterized protein FWK35_00035784, partial [Aphis craccivora]